MNYTENNFRWDLWWLFFHVFSWVTFFFHSDLFPRLVKNFKFVTSNLSKPSDRVDATLEGRMALQLLQFQLRLYLRTSQFMVKRCQESKRKTKQKSKSLVCRVWEPLFLFQKMSKQTHSTCKSGGLLKIGPHHFQPKFGLTGYDRLTVTHGLRFYMFQGSKSISSMLRRTTAFTSVTCWNSVSSCLTLGAGWTNKWWWTLDMKG